ncbi:cytochrome-c oxidase [Proteobacteria bacterium 005FR1]|nr:cytochrome-c oxidase [Proteobacteria bacterium 005FR1]
MSLLQTLTETPWNSHADEASAVAAHAGTPSVAPQRVALWFFLGIVAVLFALFSVAYVVRMDLQDWRPMPESPALWVNTGMLFLSSLALQWTRMNLHRNAARVRAGLLLGALTTIAFVVGQLLVWRAMSADGYIVYGNPANSFFYVLTGLHALHILGGLWVWIRTGVKVRLGASPDEVRLSIELCSTYWHFLLLVWLVVFALLSYT